MTKWICYPVPDTPSSGGLEGCLGPIIGVFIIGYLIVSGISHLFGWDRSNNAVQPAYTTSARTQNTENSENNETQKNSTAPKRHTHLIDYASDPTGSRGYRHKHLMKTEMTTPQNENSDLHSNSSISLGAMHERIRGTNQDSIYPSESSVGDLHSDSSIGSGSRNNDSGDTPSSNSDISGGLH